MTAGKIASIAVLSFSKRFIFSFLFILPFPGLHRFFLPGTISCEAFCPREADNCKYNAAKKKKKVLDPPSAFGLFMQKAIAHFVKTKLQ